MSLGVHRPRAGPPSTTLAGWSRGALDRGLAYDAELTIAAPGDEARVRGAFQRGVDCAGPSARRGTGGPVVRVGPGTIWITLALAHPAALVPCTPDKLVNRYVRPILRALTKTGSAASYFGRDWISVAKRPCAWIGFAHDAGTGRAVIEALVAARTPFADSARDSFRGKEPTTLEEIAGNPIALDRIADALVDAFGGGTAIELPAPDADVEESDPPWSARVHEAIGEVCAGVDARGRMRVGGEILASRDAVAALEESLARLGAGATQDEVGRAVDAAFARDGVVIEGVRSLASIRDAIVRASQNRP